MILEKRYVAFFPLHLQILAEYLANKWLEFSKHLLNRTEALASNSSLAMNG